MPARQRCGARRFLRRRAAILRFALRPRPWQRWRAAVERRSQIGRGQRVLRPGRCGELAYIAAPAVLQLLADELIDHLGAGLCALTDYVSGLPADRTGVRLPV